MMSSVPRLTQQTLPRPESCIAWIHAGTVRLSPCLQSERLVATIPVYNKLASSRDKRPNK